MQFLPCSALSGAVTAKWHGRLSILTVLITKINVGFYLSLSQDIYHIESSEQESVELHVWGCLPNLGDPLKVGLQSAAQSAPIKLPCFEWSHKAKPPESTQPSSALPIVLSKGQNSYSHNWQKGVSGVHRGRHQSTKPLGISLVPIRITWLSQTAPR